MSPDISSMHIRGKAGLAVNRPVESVPTGWVWVPLNSIARQETGHTPSRSHPEWWGGDIPWIGIRDARLHHGGVIHDTLQTTNTLGLANSSARLLPKGTVCLSRTASVGYVTIMGREMATSQDFVTWTCSEALLPEFLVKALIAEGEGLRKFGKGTTHTTIYFPEIRALHICLPPLAEQKRIVAKLDTLNAKSVRARTDLARIETLVSRYKQAVLSKAFSGELTSADAAEQNRDGAIGHPPHWRQMQLGEIADIKSGITLGKKRKPDEQLLELPYLRVANVQRGWLDLREMKTIEVTAREAEALILRAGDVLMNEGGDRDKLGRGWVWDGQIADCIHQNHVFRVRLTSGTVPPRFLSYYANEFGQKHFFDEGKQTTNLASISKSKLSAMQVPVPPFEEAKEIVRHIESAFAMIDRLAAEARRALELVGKLDEAILAKAFRGELVAQDENDGSAQRLLERIRGARAAAPKVARRRRRR
ncbi:restriction endonuclease subunit S [Rhizobium redzepovicii]|uniref:Restriction endonuclease subunit S n=1 Tax=Rhizobium redzepovicii TaxID=2867518 RepID=A0AAW8NTM3_9HYPH|nr:restriction endonuclease subunit S [Rhizobium redzepovicii]MDR9758289.1 restriction endonuclease subunit S [Rhizobium redzepovicii]